MNSFLQSNYFVATMLGSHLIKKQTKKIKGKSKKDKEASALFLSKALGNRLIEIPYKKQKY